MKHILVCVKAVPVSSSVEVDGQHRLKRDGASLQWNIADESALEAAFRLADKDGSVTVLTMGPPKLEGPLLELLARGASRAVLITDRLMAGADTRATARALASAAEKTRFWCGSPEIPRCPASSGASAFYAFSPAGADGR